MFEHILSAVKRFFKVANILDRSLIEEAKENGKCPYVSEENLAELQEAKANLDAIQEEKKEALQNIQEADQQSKAALVGMADEAAKEGIAIAKNFSLASKIQAGMAIAAAASLGGIALTELLTALFDNYKSAEKDKAFNEKLYERLLKEEYEERQYIIGLLEDRRKQKEIEASQSVITLPVVTQMIAPPPAPIPPPAPAPRPYIPPKPEPKPEPQSVPQEPVVESETEPVIEVPSDVSEPVFEDKEKTSYPKPVLMDQETTENSTAMPIEEAATVSETNMEPPPVPNIYGTPPKMDFSRKNFGFWESSITEKALKALGLEEPMKILGGTVVTTIIIHYIEVALNEIHDLVVKRLANTEKK